MEQRDKYWEFRHSDSDSSLSLPVSVSSSRDGPDLSEGCIMKSLSGSLSDSKRRTKKIWAASVSARWFGLEIAWQ